LCREHAPADLQTDRLAKLDPATAAVGAVAINRLGLFDRLCLCGERGQDEKEGEAFHLSFIA